MSTAEQQKEILWLKFISGPGNVKHQVITETMEAMKKGKHQQEHEMTLNCLPLNRNVYLKADQTFLSTDEFPRLQYGMKNISLNTLNILDTLLDGVDIVFEETTLEETLIYTLAYRSNLSISHFSFSLLMNTYEEEENKSRQLKIDRNIIYVYLGDRPELSNLNMHKRDIRDNYTMEFTSTIQSLITLDYMRRNATKIMLKPLQVGIEETAEELANIILKKISSTRNTEEKLSTSPASPDVVTIH